MISMTKNVITMWFCRKLKAQNVRCRNKKSLPVSVNDYIRNDSRPLFSPPRGLSSGVCKKIPRTGATLEILVDNQGY